MILSDFLSWQNNDNSNPHKIIPISFNMYQTKSSGTKLLEVHGMRKNLDPNLKPEKQHAMP